MNPTARRIIRYETLDGILHALWDDGNGNRKYEPVEDSDGNPGIYAIDEGQELSSLATAGILRGSGLTVLFKAQHTNQTEKGK